MTREEAIKNIKEHCYFANLIPPTKEALDMAIKALEQEPCEDAVSRQAVIDALDKSKYSNEFCEEHHIDWSINLGMAHIVVNELKPVIPQPKMGRWLNLKDVYCDICESVCSVCDYNGNYKWSYCPNCGAKMQEVEE